MKFSTSALAALLLTTLSTSVHAGFAVGGGYPYGGVIGIQYSQQQQQHLWTGAVGVVGAAVGYHYVLDVRQQHSVGVVFGMESISSEQGFAALQYSYYLAGANNVGWVAGVNLGTRREDAGSFYASRAERSNKTLLGLHLGYRF